MMHFDQHFAAAAPRFELCESLGKLVECTSAIEEWRDAPRFHPRRELGESLRRRSSDEHRYAPRRKRTAQHPAQRP